MQRYAHAEHWHQVSPGRQLRGSSLDAPKAALDRCPELATTHRLVCAFGDMLTHQTGMHLPAQIGEALAADLPGLNSLTSDLDAVTAGARASPRAQ